jgi:plasmid stabilization system protein ParE
MGPWRVALSTLAERDLERVTAFIAQKSATAAERIGLEIVGIIFSLQTLPSRGAPLRGRPSLRKVVHRHYLIVYRMDQTARLVEVVRVWDGRRDPSDLRLP